MIIVSQFLIIIIKINKLIVQLIYINYQINFKQILSLLKINRINYKFKKMKFKKKVVNKDLKKWKIIMKIQKSKNVL